MVKLVLFVLTSSVGLPPTRVLVSLNRAVPVHVALLCRLNTTVPPAARLPAVDVIVAVSFGVQLCFVLISVGICRTVTFSVPVVSGQAVAPTLSVFGGSPLYDATHVYSPGVLGWNSATVPVPP